MSTTLSVLHVLMAGRDVRLPGDVILGHGGLPALDPMLQDFWSAFPCPPPWNHALLFRVNWTACVGQAMGERLKWFLADRCNIAHDGTQLLPDGGPGGGGGAGGEEELEAPDVCAVPCIIMIALACLVFSLVVAGVVFCVCRKRPKNSSPTHLSALNAHNADNAKYYTSCHYASAPVMPRPLETALCGNNRTETRILKGVGVGDIGGGGTSSSCSGSSRQLSPYHQQLDHHPLVTPTHHAPHVHAHCHTNNVGGHLTTPLLLQHANGTSSLVRPGVAGGVGGGGGVGDVVVPLSVPASRSILSYLRLKDNNPAVISPPLPPPAVAPPGVVGGGGTSSFVGGGGGGGGGTGGLGGMTGGGGGGGGGGGDYTSSSAASQTNSDRGSHTYESIGDGHYPAPDSLRSYGGGGGMLGGGGGFGLYPQGGGGGGGGVGVDPYHPHHHHHHMVPNPQYPHQHQYHPHPHHHHHHNPDVSDCDCGMPHYDQDALATGLANARGGLLEGYYADRSNAQTLPVRHFRHVAPPTRGGGGGGSGGSDHDASPFGGAGGSPFGGGVGVGGGGSSSPGLYGFDMVEDGPSPGGGGGGGGGHGGLPGGSGRSDSRLSNQSRRRTSSGSHYSDRSLGGGYREGGGGSVIKRNIPALHPNYFDPPEPPAPDTFKS